MASGGVTLGNASFAGAAPDGHDTRLASADSPLAAVPADGATYAVLSTGDATQADQPRRNRPAKRRTAQTPTDSRRHGARHHGAGDPDRRACRHQLPVVRLPLPVRGVPRRSSASSSTTPSSPSSTPRRGRTATATPTISGLENDFALDPDGHPVTINSTGQSRMSAADAAGTPYGGATAPLRAKTAVTPGRAHDLPVDLRSERSEPRQRRLRRCSRVEQRVGRDVRARLPGRRPGGRDHRPGPGFTSRTRFPTLTGSAGNGPGDAADRDRPRLQRRGHVRRAGRRRSARRATARRGR